MMQLFTEPGTAYTLFWLALAGVGGIYLGKISVFGIRIGIAGVLFSGLLLGALGVTVDSHVLHFIKEFGLVLFVFTVGIQVGPGFFRSLRSEGLLFNILAGCLVLGGVAIAAFHTYVFDIPTEVMVGLLSGAVTNTPGLGAAQQSLQEILGPQAAQSAGAAYAVAYPFGIMGIILAAIFIKFLFKISPDTEQEQFDQELQARTSQLQVKNICILNPNLANKSIQELIDACKDRIVISRILHSSPSSAAPQNPNNEPNWSPINEVLPAEPNHILQINDVLLAVGTQSALNHLVLLAGGESNIDLRQTAGRMASKKVLITCKAVTKQSLQDLNLVGRYRANLTRIIRSGVQFTPVPNMQLHLGDIVTVVAPEQDMEIVVNELGNTPKDLHHPNMLLLFIGISAGLLLGSIAIPIPGLPTPVKLGMAGGPLVVALIMGRLGKVGSLNMYLHPGANLVLREMGILLFLACVGLGSGKSFIPALLGENGLAWVLMGASITFIPVFTVGVIARIKKLNYLSISGLLAGAMTDPPALGYANSIKPCQAQSIAYASVYPLTMLLRIMTAQLFVLISL